MWSNYMNKLTAAQKITKARNKLLCSHPFFGVLALKLIAKEDNTHSTGWVDGTTLGYNAAWIDSLSIQQIMGFVAHEVMHCVYKHMTRRKNRNPRKWNEAGDYVINLGLQNEKFELPPGGLIDEQYADMSTDHIYTLLPDEPEGEGGGDGTGDMPWGEVRDGKSQSTSEVQQQEQDWTVATAQAAEAAKKAGKLSGDMTRLVDTIIEPKVPWREVLRNFMSSHAKDDYTMTRPNRRFVTSGLYLPDLYSESLGKVVVTVDTSGSISTEELNTFCSEINCILEDTHPEKVTVLYCDTKVHEDYDEYTYDDLPVKLEGRGGGGTDFTEPFNWLADRAETPAAFIYLTDLYGSCNAPPPDYPVLWVSTTSLDTVPFGEVIHMS